MKDPRNNLEGPPPLGMNLISSDPFFKHLMSSELPVSTSMLWLLLQLSLLEVAESRVGPYKLTRLLLIRVAASFSRLLYKFSWSNCSREKIAMLFVWKKFLILFSISFHFCSDLGYTSPVFDASYGPESTLSSSLNFLLNRSSPSCTLVWSLSWLSDSVKVVGGSSRWKEKFETWSVGIYFLCWCRNLWTGFSV